MKLICLEHHMTRVRKSLTKARNNDALQNTAENLVKNGKMPEGGLQELGKYISSALPWVLSLKQEDFRNPKNYNHFMGWLYSSFYMSVQGRIGGIQDMRVGQADNLMEGETEYSQHFKTSSYHSFQAVSISEIAAKGLQIYVTLARPVIVGDNTALDHDEAFLFLTSNAKPEYMAGSRVTEFFFVVSGGKYHICTTAIRAMIETESDNLFEKGLITLEQKNSVQRLGGHNGATVKKHYIKKKLHHSVMAAREVMNIVHNSDDTTAHAFVTPVLTTVTTVNSSCATDTEGDRNNGMDLDFSYDIIQDADYVDNHQTHDVNIHGRMYWCDNGIPSSSSSSSSSSSYAAAAAGVGVGVGVATNAFISENPMHDNAIPHSLSSSSSTSSSSSSSAGVGVAVAAADTFISENTMQSSNVNASGGAPLPLPFCRIGQLHRAKRVMWSNDEKDMVREIYNVLNDELPDEQKRYMTTLVLQRILQDHRTPTTFHPAHLLSSKIRHAIRTYTSNSHNAYNYDDDYDD